MKLYFCASYARRSELRQIAPMFEAAGHTVVSSWIHGDGDDCTAAAEQDIADLYRADAVVYFAETRHSSGRSFELGWAYGKGKLCVVVGEERCVFFTLPGIVRVADVSAALEAAGAKVEVVR